MSLTNEDQNPYEDDDRTEIDSLFGDSGDCGVPASAAAPMQLYLPFPTPPTEKLDWQDRPPNTSTLPYYSPMPSIVRDDKSPLNEQSQGHQTPNGERIRQYGAEAEVNSLVASQKNNECGKDMNFVGFPNMSQLPSVEHVKCVSGADTEHEDDDRPVLPRQRWRRKQLLSLSPDTRPRLLIPFTEQSLSNLIKVESTREIRSLKQLQRRKKPGRIFTNLGLNVSCNMNAPSASTIVSTEVEFSLPFSFY